jgi:hypothetical protein
MPEKPKTSSSHQDTECHGTFDRKVPFDMAKPYQETQTISKILPRGRPPLGLREKLQRELDRLNDQKLARILLKALSYDIKKTPTSATAVRKFHAASEVRRRIDLGLITSSTDGLTLFDRCVEHLETHKPVNSLSTVELHTSP